MNKLLLFFCTTTTITTQLQLQEYHEIFTTADDNQAKLKSVGVL
ncbi:hypothetical protein DOY81_002968 [Sarcophaga bullata]|nr:hypothetical protein DOY81_002968 [Sarcophaga bullata]